MAYAKNYASSYFRSRFVFDADGGEMKGCHGLTRSAHGYTGVRAMWIKHAAELGGTMLRQLGILLRSSGER